MLSPELLVALVAVLLLVAGGWRGYALKKGLW